MTTNKQDSEVLKMNSKMMITHKRLSRVFARGYVLGLIRRAFFIAIIIQLGSLSLVAASHDKSADTKPIEHWRHLLFLLPFHPTMTQVERQETEGWIYENIAQIHEQSDSKKAAFCYRQAAKAYKKPLFENELSDSDCKLLVKKILSSYNSICSIYKEKV